MRPLCASVVEDGLGLLRVDVILVNRLGSPSQYERHICGKRSCLDRYTGHDEKAAVILQ